MLEYNSNNTTVICKYNSQAFSILKRRYLLFDIQMQLGGDEDVDALVEKARITMVESVLYKAVVVAEKGHGRRNHHDQQPDSPVHRWRDADH